MKRINLFSVIFVFLLFSLVCYSQTTNTKVKATIEYEQKDGNITITGTAENLTEVVESMSYTLSVIKKNTSNKNTSNNIQEGFFSLNPSENKNLSTTQINLGNDDEVIVLLLFYNESKKLIGKDRVVFGNEKKKVETLPFDGFELKGIVSDETKTKMGKDFYDFYYYLYNRYKINSEQVVVINEEFSFSRNTKITVNIKNEVVNEFLSRPDEEYLEAMAEQSIYQTYLYLKNLEKESKYFTQY